MQTAEAEGRGTGVKGHQLVPEIRRRLIEQANKTVMAENVTLPDPAKSINARSPVFVQKVDWGCHGSYEICDDLPYGLRPRNSYEVCNTGITNEVRYIRIP
jgi:hypothetical protein